MLHHHLAFHREAEHVSTGYVYRLQDFEGPLEWGKVYLCVLETLSILTKIIMIKITLATLRLLQVQLNQ
jgi:hypothetical protein